ncbi:DUF1294 domain-containing protein [Sporosarcina sp. FA9]|uniref:DUF1294 domain-containing protein n=1 Tax=Sporosarcina sp. FA9 TaxID=3413030 RepID=UPI003F654B79
MQTVVLIWIGLMSLWSFATMGYDKQQAKKKGRRVPEKKLWTLALLGGGIGSYLGMQTFRHKTRHTSFRIGFLLLALAYGVLILYLLGLRIPGTPII